MQQGHRLREGVSPLLVMLGLSGKRRTDRLTLDLAGLGTQMSFARAAGVDGALAGTGATAGQAHQAMADTVALLTGAGVDGPARDDDPGPDDPAGSGPGTGPDGGDGTAGGGQGGSGAAFMAASAGGGPRTGPPCPGAAIPVLGPGHHRPTVVMLDGTGARAGEATNGVGVNLAIGLTGRSGPAGRRRAHTHFLGLTVDQDWSMMGAQLEGTPAPCLDPNLRKALAHLGGPELATGVIERLMREINARTDIGGVRWTITGIRDLLTVLTAWILRHPAWTEIHSNTRPANTIQFRLQKFNAT